MFFPQGGMSYQYLLRDIYEDLIQRLVDISSDDNIFVSQPCRDNTLYLLRLVDEMLISELDIKLPVLNIPEIIGFSFCLYCSQNFYLCHFITRILKKLMNNLNLFLWQGICTLRFP